jgi:DNA-binding ferritin-like protein (Dps family)
MTSHEKQSVKKEVKEIKEVLGKLIQHHNEVVESIKILGKALSFMENFIMDKFEANNIATRKDLQLFIETTIKKDQEEQRKKQEEAASKVLPPKGIEEAIIVEEKKEEPTPIVEVKEEVIKPIEVIENKVA